MPHPNDPKLRSFIDVPADSHFPIQNLPFGVFKPAQGAARVGVAIGDLVLDLSVLEEQGKFASAGLAQDGIFAADSLSSLGASATGMFRFSDHPFSQR